jgi:DNA invertase Pin-like site-specific DNA recombinase
MSEKVAAYIRVSTDATDQENSFETQERYFNQLLSKNPEWVSAGIYSDYGISGTDGEKRQGFKRIIRHCKEGRIDRIVCKSISRFARNTADFVTTIKILKNCNVTILFENEALDTADPSSEFVLTTLGAIAQEESRSISSNINWGNQKRFPRGEVRNHDLYGYRYNGKTVITESGYRYRDIEIVEDEAKVVQRIFTEAAEDVPFVDIAKGLNQDGIAPPETYYSRRRKEKSLKGQLDSQLDEGWTSRHISQMLTRERYVGDVRIQKTYTADYLTHRKRTNKGEVEQYLVHDHHPAIVSRKLYDAAQKVKERNTTRYGTRGDKIMQAFSGRIICGECGRYYNVRHSKDRPVWFCPSTSRNNGRVICHAKNLHEWQIVKMYRQAISDRFHLTTKPQGDNVNMLDIMGGLLDCDGDDGYVAQMRARLEGIQLMDYMERDRTFLKRRIENAKDVVEKQRLTERLEYLENYWGEVEKDFEQRQKAIEWLETLPKGEEGIKRLIDGMTDEYLKAFVLSITVHSPKKCTVHWFDDTRTEVEMGDLI